MSLISRLRRVLPCVHSEPSEPLVHAMNAFAAVKDQSVRAAQGLRQAAEDHRVWIGAARQQIGERAEAELAKRPNPSTSQARERIDAIIKTIIAEQRGDL